MLPEILSDHIQNRLSEILGASIIINGSSPVPGGDINDAYRLETNTGPYFIKRNSADKYPDMFAREAKGLTLLQQSGEIAVPKVIDNGETGKHAYLLLKYIETATQRSNFWEAFGTALARMHRHKSEFFGLDHDNYIGSLVQLNNKHNDWVSFFITERLERQAKMAMDKGLFGSSTIKKLEKLYSILHNIFPIEPPSLIHGDLWSGNYMTGPQGAAVIIDPAVYYGHREMDIAMSRLFGSFGNAFYDAYNHEYAMEPGWNGRLSICNLYPLMVHVNLFGAGYVGSVESILSQF